MKKILLFTLATVVSFAIYAQNNSLYIMSKYTGDTLNGKTHIIYGDGANFEVKEEFKAVQTQMDSMYVAIRRMEVRFIPGTKDYFCWFLCYSPVDAGTLKDWYAEDTLWMYQDVVINNLHSKPTCLTLRWL